MGTAVGSDLHARRAAYSAIATRLAHMDDRKLRATLKPPFPRQSPWRYTYETTVGASKVFVKRIPVTDLERARPWSTKNVFRLPTYYSYGVGSAGFGAVRELVAHITSTNWVLEGASPSFPMLFHHRLLARRPTSSRSLRRLDAYVERWNGNRAIGEAMRLRAQATTEIWLVLEHVPHEMTSWILDHQSKVDDVVQQLCEVTAFLRSRGMVHFDLHFGNVVTDGQTIRVADFGLANDGAFDLSNSERSFLDRHQHYDLAEALACIGLALIWRFEDLDDLARKRAVRLHPWLAIEHDQTRWLMTFIDTVDSFASGPLRVEPVYADALRRYREVILYMSRFLSTMRANPKKDTRYEDDHVRGLLEKADLLG